MYGMRLLIRRRISTRRPDNYKRIRIRIRSRGKECIFRSIRTFDATLGFSRPLAKRLGLPRAMSGSTDPRTRLADFRRRGLLSLNEYLDEIAALDAEHERLDRAAMSVDGSNERDEQRSRSDAAEHAAASDDDDGIGLVGEDGWPYEPDAAATPAPARKRAEGTHF